MKRLILVGFMGSGKSTVGRLISAQLKLPLIEMDREIEVMAELPISKIFSIYGEDRFREIEREVLLNSLSQEGVIATGGGVLTREENRESLINEPTVIYLKGSIETLLRNVKKDTRNTRPLAQNSDKKTLEALLNERSEAYEKVANKTVIIDNKSIKEIVTEVLEELT